jgi:hypothetical protein
MLTRAVCVLLVWRSSKLLSCSSASSAAGASSSSSATEAGASSEGLQTGHSWTTSAADTSSVTTAEDYSSTGSTAMGAAARRRVKARHSFAAPAGEEQLFLTAAQCPLSNTAPFGWLKTAAAAASRAQALAGQLEAIYHRIASLAHYKHWYKLRGGAAQIDLLEPQLGMAPADIAVVEECARLMLQAVRALAPRHPTPLRLAQLKLLYCADGVGRQPLHFDLGVAEHLCFSALMAGCDTVGTHLPLAPLDEQRELYQGSVAERRAHRLCSDQLQRIPANFTSERVATGDIVAFRCDTLHAGPLNDTGSDRFMLYALFTPLSYGQQKGQGDYQHYPCGGMDGRITARHLAGTKRPLSHT